MMFGRERMLRGQGNGPIDALIHALGVQATVHSYEERAAGHGADATAVAYVEMMTAGVPGTTFGAGMHQNIVTASVLAVVSGVNRLYDKLDDSGKAGFFLMGEKVPSA
jgi:2-isopropylmalate synthase